LKAAYVDTSCLVAIAFGESEAAQVVSRLREHDVLLSSNLLEAELRATLVREAAEVDEALFSWIKWVLPDRPLSVEIIRVLRAGYLRGADLWHLATAMYVTPEPRDLTFLTLDRRQEEVAEELGFKV
jgi:predicted nucleic acid-binding protein|tara:strand:- start:4910 stop:5290 length:381 start_codon:yes stop_codon:yes gene_type:complete